ncbi:MAG TPA: hypothetical protein VLA64_14570, partial [Azonexus sp.]|nr:hypothetical protein [Azonexus sp.]
MYKHALGLLKTLRGFVFIAMVGVAALVFLGATLASSLLYEKLLEERSLVASGEIAQQNFDSIFQVLRRGGSHQQVEEIAADSIRAFPSTVDQISVYRGATVEAQYGRLVSAVLPAEAGPAMTNGTSSVLKSDGHLRYFYPVAAEAACLQCHANAQAGEVLGVIAIQHKLQTVTATARIYYVALFLILGLLVLLVAAALTTFLTRKLNRSLELFSDKVDSFNNIKDFEHLDISKV